MSLSKDERSYERGINRMKVGFIGLGNMGGPMARNVAKAGFEMTVLDLRRELMAPFLGNGASGAGSAAEVAAVSDIVFTSLPGPVEMEAVAIGEGGVLEGLRPGSVYVDLTTNRPSLVRRIEPMFREKGCVMLDAPVSGGVPGAVAGRLAVMVSGDEETYNRCKSVLDAIGDKAQYCGSIGCGTICKLAHNAINYAFMEAVGECFTVAVKAGVEPEVVWKAVRDGAVGRGVALHVSIPGKVLKGDFSPDFALKLAMKDVTLAAELGEEYDVPMPAIELALKDIREAVGRGWGEEDSRSVIKLHEERAGVELRFQGGAKSSD